jgi:hypothetical protein
MVKLFTPRKCDIRPRRADDHSVVEPPNIPVDKPFDGLLGLGRLSFDPASCVVEQQTRERGRIMAKRKKGSKVRKRAKQRRGNSAKRAKTRKLTKAAKRTVAKAKPKPALAKKAAQKEAVAPAVETLVDTSEIREESEPKPPSLI